MLRRVRVGARIIEYDLIQTGRRSLELRASDQGPPRLFTPKGFRLREADEFVRDRADWLFETAAQMRAIRARSLAERPMRDGADLLLEGAIVTLSVSPADRDEVCFDQGKAHVLARDPGPESVRAQLKAALIARARETLNLRVAHFASIVGRAPGRVTVRDQKTRWGSCSSLGNVNFNWKLIMAPPQALDYVVVHELCHLYELNHSRRFWNLVERVLPDYQDAKKWLKENGRLLGV